MLMCAGYLVRVRVRVRVSVRVRVRVRVRVKVRGVHHPRAHVRRIPGEGRG